MRPASPTKVASLAAATMLLMTSVTAAPTIAGWDFETNGKKEVVTLRWNEAGAFQINEFPQSREVLIVFPQSRLQPGTNQRLDLSGSRAIERARLQEVTLPTGDKALQLRLDLHEWTSIEANPSSDSITLTLDVPQSRLNTPATTGSNIPQSGWVFTDADIETIGQDFHGAFDAPRTGAGQAPQPAAAANPFEEYWVPPAVDPAVARTRPTRTDLGQLAVENRLDEMVLRVDFQGTSLENVLRLISERAELNILIRPADVAGRTVTFRFRNVTLRQMLDAILKANDLGYIIEDGGIVRIVPRNQVRFTERETVTETVAINWVDAREVRTSLQPFVDTTDGTIQVSEASNLLIIRDVPENVQRILDLVSQIDQPEKQVLIEMRLVNMSESARRELGTRTDWQTRQTRARMVTDPATGSVGSVTRSATDSFNRGFQQQSQFNEQFSSAQVFPQTGSFQSQSTFNTAASGTNTFADAVNLIPQSAGQMGLLGTTAEAFQLSQLATVSFFNRDFDVDFALNAQEERGEAVTLANPKVLSLNNQPARVEIKRQIPFVSAISAVEGAVGTIEFKDVGTEVNILPRITNHGWVQMQIEPEQIIDTGDRPQGVPVTDERRVMASVIVKDEMTVAIGGLRQFSSTATEAGVPYLLRVPVLSWLFKRQVNEQNKTELYLFVTPHIVKDPTPTAYQMALYDKIDYNWDLPDYYFDEVTPRRSPAEDDPTARYPRY